MRSPINEDDAGDLDRFGKELGVDYIDIVLIHRVVEKRGRSWPR